MPRIQVYADREMKRRIELAAARQDVPVTQYCLEAIEQRLADEAVLDAERIEIPVKPELDASLLADIQALREKILADRGGRLVELDRIVEDMRDERDGEVAGLR